MFSKLAVILRWVQFFFFFNMVVRAIKSDPGLPFKFQLLWRLCTLVTPEYGQCQQLWPPSCPPPFAYVVPFAWNALPLSSACRCSVYLSRPKSNSISSQKPPTWLPGWINNPPCCEFFQRLCLLHFQNLIHFTSSSLLLPTEHQTRVQHSTQPSSLVCCHGSEVWGDSHGIATTVGCQLWIHSTENSHW